MNNEINFDAPSPDLVALIRAIMLEMNPSIHPQQLNSNLSSQSYSASTTPQPAVNQPHVPGPQQPPFLGSSISSYSNPFAQPALHSSFLSASLPSAVKLKDLHLHDK